VSATPHFLTDEVVAAGAKAHYEHMRGKAVVTPAPWAELEPIVKHSVMEFVLPILQAAVPLVVEQVRKDSQLTTEQLYGFLRLGEQGDGSYKLQTENPLERESDE
jgi:hypothetical protein